MHRPGTIVDIGAHEGRLTLPLTALPNSRVVAFEPLPPSFARLQAAVAAAWGGHVPAHVTLRQEALGDHAGTITISAPQVFGVLQAEWASIVKDYEGMRREDARIEAVESWTVPLLR